MTLVEQLKPGPSTDPNMHQGDFFKRCLLDNECFQDNSNKYTTIDPKYIVGFYSLEPVETEE